MAECTAPPTGHTSLAEAHACPVHACTCEWCQPGRYQEEDARKASDQEKVSPYIQGKEDFQYHMEQHDLCRFCICCKKGSSDRGEATRARESADLAEKARRIKEGVAQ
jgi:hypothetical protein